MPSQRRRVLTLLAGLAVLAVALGPLDAAADRRLSAHMVQHLLLWLGAAPLLVAAAPVRLTLRVLSRDGRAALARLLHSRLARVLSAPATGLALFTAVTLTTHVPAVYDVVIAHGALHAGEHALYLWTAMLLWAPIIAADPLPHHASPLARVAVMLLAMTAMTAPAVALVSADTVLYAHYAGPGALADQQLAGVIMWLGGALPFAAIGLVAIWGALAGEERRMAAREAHALEVRR